MHKTIIWWSAWGLIVGIGFFGLKEAQRDSVHFILCLPLLSGAAAAAILRLKHEYHEAVLHAKWVSVTTGLFLLGSGYLYLKAEAYGPFATASAHKAFLGTTFEMSVREVERTLGRQLEQVGGKYHPPDGLKDWVFEVMPAFDAKSDLRQLSDLILYRVPCRAQFEFIGGRLGRVDLQFEPTTTPDSTALLRRLQEEMEKEYRPMEESGSSHESAALFRKESVQAFVRQSVLDPRHQKVSVLLEYTPLAEKRPGPLTVNAKVF